MEYSDITFSEKVIYTVADVLGEDPLDLPPLEQTLSGDALDTLFHPSNQLPGAYTLFPYCNLWVMVHSTGTVNVFEQYVGTNLDNDLPDPVSPPVNDERVAIVYADGNVYTFYRDALDELDEIVETANGYEDVWERAKEFAHTPV